MAYHRGLFWGLLCSVFTWTTYRPLLSFQVSYVDDTKVYLSCSSKNIKSCLAKVSEDLRLIASWCCTNKLLINPDKSKPILFGTKQLLSKVLDIRIPFIGQHLTPVSSVKDLGVILESNLTFNEHVHTLTSSLVSILFQISRVRHLFSKSVLTTILNCLVFCKIFYCSTVWSSWNVCVQHKQTATCTKLRCPRVD